MTHPHNTSSVSRLPVRKPTLPPRPWNADEIRARSKAECALARAKECATAGNPKLAMAYCLTGQKATWGFTRPFAIRDQITDFMLQVDPHGSIRRAFVLRSLEKEAQALRLRGQQK